MHLTEWTQEQNELCRRGSNDGSPGYSDEEGAKESFARESNSAKVGCSDGPRRVWESQFETHDLFAQRGQSKSLTLVDINCGRARRLTAASSGHSSPGCFGSPGSLFGEQGAGSGERIGKDATTLATVSYCSPLPAPRSLLPYSVTNSTGTFAGISPASAARVKSSVTAFRPRSP